MENLAVAIVFFTGVYCLPIWETCHLAASCWSNNLDIHFKFMFQIYFCCNVALK